MQNELLGLKVLFIEDDLEINKKIGARLERYFSNVYSARSAEDGYEVYLHVKPDVMIVDINLPKMNGVELVRKIRKRDQNTKIVMLTAKSDAQTLLEATELKLTKYLIKPLNRKTLEEMINQLVYEIDNFKVINEKIIYFKDGFSWSREKCELYSRGTKVSLTPIEYKIISYLIENLNRTVSHDSIIAYVWRDEFDDKKLALKTALKNLRKKLPDNLIGNEFGRGYVIKV